MWKLSCIVLLLIKIGNSATHDHPGTTEISRNFRNYGNQRYRIDERRIEYSEEDYDRRGTDDYSDEFEGEELIGKWRNSGTALEPKWRDGDSLPLVPFDDSPGQKKFTRQDVTNDERKVLSSSIITEKSIDPKERSSKIHIDNEETIDKIRIPLQYERSSLDAVEMNDRYSGKKNHDNHYEINEDPSSDKNQFSQYEEFTRIPSTRLTNSMLYESDENIENTGERTRKIVKIENKEFYNNGDTVKSPYSDSFQVDLNEYDINDEEYQKPRSRKRRPPEMYGFDETRPPTYSITWSTEKYIENTGIPKKISTTSTRKPEVTFLREDREKKNVQNRKLDKSSNFDSRRKPENNELKTLLKMQQIEGFSLSELLQRRNLTLNDLLGGKAEVLNALKSNDNESTEVFGVRSKIFEPKKLYQNRSRVEKNFNSSFNEIWTISRSEKDPDIESSTKEREIVDSAGKTDSKESEDSERSANENEKLSAIVGSSKPIILPHLHFSTEKSNFESTSERKFEKDFLVAYRNNENIERKNVTTSTLDDDEIMEFSDFTVKKIETTTIVNGKSTNGEYEINLNDDSGSTLSIENILGSTQQTAIISSMNETNNVNKKVNVAITNEEKSNFSVSRILDFDYQSDQPGETINEEITNKKVVNDEQELKMSNDNSYERTTKKIDEITSSNNLPKNHLIFSTSSKPYELIVSEIEPEARAEISELFSTGSSAKRLESLLKSRNMSIDELIELRQRGSSKVHLAEILRSRDTINSRNYKNDDKIIIETPRDEKTTETTIAETTTDDLSNVEFESSSTETKESEMSEEHTNIAFIGTEKTKFHSTMEKDNEKNQQLLELLKAFDSLPFSIRPDTIFTEKSLNEDKTKISSIVDINITERPKNPENLVEIGVVEEIIEKESTDNDDFTETNIRTNYSSIGKNSEKKIFSKVRPSIIASGAILGVTIVVFLAIFIVCRIKQKQKYTYRNTFSRAVFQGPATTARKLSNSSSINTIMVNVVATSTSKRPERRDKPEIDENFESKSDIENDSLDANDSWETIPDFMK